SVDDVGRQRHRNQRDQPPGGARTCVDSARAGCDPTRSRAFWRRAQQGALASSPIHPHDADSARPSGGMIRTQRQETVTPMSETPTPNPSTPQNPAPEAASAPAANTPEPAASAPEPATAAPEAAP